MTLRSRAAFMQKRHLDMENGPFASLRFGTGGIPTPRRRLVVTLSVLGVVGGLFAGATFIPWPSDPSMPGPGETPFTKGSGLCAGKLIMLEFQLSQEEGITVRTGTRNNHSWTPAFLFLEVGSAFAGRCNAWGDYVGLRHLTVAFYAQDKTAPFRADDVWMGPLDVTQTTGGGMAIWDRNLETREASQESVAPDGRRLFTSLDLEWKPSKVNSVNVSFLLAVFDLPAEPHVGDVLRFTAVLTMTIGETLCAGLCWSPSADQPTEVLALETTVRGEPI